MSGNRTQAMHSGTPFVCRSNSLLCALLSRRSACGISIRNSALIFFYDVSTALSWQVTRKLTARRGNKKFWHPIAKGPSKKLYPENFPASEFKHAGFYTFIRHIYAHRRSVLTSLLSGYRMAYWLITIQFIKTYTSRINNLTYRS